MRGLVAESFELLEFAFGSAIVTEGEPADAFYVLTYGSARVLKQAANGEEVSLNTLQRGDTFGETGLLEEAGVRQATVRASSDVQVLRLHASVFAALSRRHRRCGRHSRTWLASGRSGTSSASTRASRRCRMRRSRGSWLGLEPVQVPETYLVISKGDPPGPAYVVEEGRLRSFHVEDGLERNLAITARATSSVSARSSSASRAPPRSRRSTTAHCYGFPSSSPRSWRTIRSSERIEERVVQYDFKRLARVPLDFADDILPAEASAEERRSR